MKKIIAFLLATMMILSSAACMAYADEAAQEHEPDPGGSDPSG